jgi:CheY-like chemotaxis protein
MGIQGSVSIMLADMDPTHPHFDRLNGMEKRIQSGANLTSHLLGYARKGKYQLKALDLNELVEETSETFGRTRKDITLVKHLADDLLPVEADAGQIEQVLMNLYVNAADAMPGGGKLILESMNTTHEAMRANLYTPLPGDYVLLTVTDTGTGMEKKTRERIFDPFFTTKEMGRGTGLGLASVYGIIKGHNGYVDVESEVGHGSAFRVFLPVSEKPVQESSEPDQSPKRGRETVLLVDDEEDIREVGRELLEIMGYRVLTAQDGEKAVELYSRDPKDIDVVLLDIVMPIMGGGEAFDRIREINPRVKVLLCSGFSIEGEATEILARGGDGFIQKPFTMNRLSDKLRQILDQE